MLAQALLRRIFTLPLDPIKDQSIFRVRTQAVIAGLAHLPCWWIWTYMYPQPYESLTWRVLNVVLSVVLLIASVKWSVHERRLHILYFFVMSMQTTWFASWFYLANNGNTVWLASYGVMILLYGMMTDWRLALVGTITGFVLSLALLPLLDPEAWALVSPEAFTGDAAVVLGFAFVMGMTIQAIDIDLSEVRLQSHLKALGVAAHEIRTPVASIGLISSAMADQVDQMPAGRIKEEMRRLVREVDRNVGLSQSLIRSHLINANPMAPVLNQKRLSCADVAQECLATFEGTDHTREGVAKLTVLSDFTVLADKLALMQALRNLLDNALETVECRHGYTPHGSISIVVARDAYGGSGTIAITDQGEGIKKADLKKVFLPFYTMNKTNGNGLGLSLVTAVVSAYKGKISITSEPGQGTTFTVRLPTTAES